MAKKPEQITPKILDEKSLSDESKSPLDAIQKEIIQAFPLKRSSRANPFLTLAGNRIDYVNTGRRMFQVEALGYHCYECGYDHPDKNYFHSSEECTVMKILFV